MLAFNVSADTDGENSLSKKNTGQVKDCFEKLNRATFKFNQALDGAIFEPAAKIYRILPTSIRKGTSNVLSNLGEVSTIANDVLQLKFDQAGNDLARFSINTTIGVLGIFDVAQSMGLPEYEKEDYGQTLGTMGVGEGCYLVLPILGPSTIRDTAGSFVNLLGGDAWYNITVQEDTKHVSDSDYYISRANNQAPGKDYIRAPTSDSNNGYLRQKCYGFIYASVRSLYLQDRQQENS